MSQRSRKDEMATDAAHTRPWEIGEVVFGVPLLLATALHFILTFPTLPERFTLPGLLGGVVLCALGVVLITATRRELARYQQPTDPGQPTRQIVTTGIFAVSRNPMYLGAACFILGIALTFKLLWLFALFIPMLVACEVILIAPEERYLRAKFGEAYTNYETSVRRWLGRKAPRERSE